MNPTTALPIPMLPDAVLAPVANPELRAFAAEALAHARSAWELFWQHPPGRSVHDLALDYDHIVAWITAVYRRHLYTLVIREKPVTVQGKAADGIVVINPLEALVDKLTLDIAKYERRIRLGVGY